MTRTPFDRAYGPWAVVAGGSEGLGAAFATEIARRGVNLLLVARRPAPLDQTSARLRRDHGVEVVTVPADLAGPAAIDQIKAAAGDREIGLVIVNAAFAPQGCFLDRAPAELAAAVDLNCPRSSPRPRCAPWATGSGRCREP